MWVCVCVRACVCLCVCACVLACRSMRSCQSPAGNDGACVSPETAIQDRACKEDPNSLNKHPAAIMCRESSRPLYRSCGKWQCICTSGGGVQPRGSAEDGRAVVSTGAAAAG